MTDHHVERYQAEQAAQSMSEPKRGTDAQILFERELTCSAINGAMAFGYQNTNPPPSDDHWLAPFWKVGRKQAEMESALLASKPAVPQKYDACDPGNWRDGDDAMGKPRHEGGISENTVYLTPDMYMALNQAPSLAFESALVELVNKIDTGLDSGDLLVDARRASSAIDSILSGGDLVACAHEYFRDSGDRYEKSIEFRIGWDACLDAIVQARAASTQAKVCSTCNGHGMIGGPSYYAPDEGGEPCPDCVAAPQPAQSPDGRVIDKAMVKRLAVQHGLLPAQPSLTDGIRKLIECAADCISEAVAWEQSGFDTPPMPATEWDYNADQLAYALRALLTAAQPPSGTPND